MTTISVSLAFPPAVNNLFTDRKYGKGRVPSDRYRAWSAEASADLIHAGTVLGTFTTHMQFQRPDKRARDLDNLAKAPLDALKKAGVIEDDSLAQRIVLEWASDKPAKGARVFIWITPVQVS